VLDWVSPREIYALHCGQLPVGEFAVMPGFGHPGQDVFEVRLSGPDAAVNARLVADLVDGLSTVRIPRTPDERQRLLEELGTPNGPLASFVFAQSQLVDDTDGRRLFVQVRAWPDERFEEVRAALRSAVDDLAGASVEFGGPPFPAMVCSAPLSEVAATHLRALLGADAVHTMHAAFPFNGEDFALFLQRVPGAMFFLGVANAEQNLNGIPHSPDFGADERAIAIGVRAMAGFLLTRIE
jgi:metal-dependent amidase/aminoacylase/carboxypeptidase family protein